MEPQASADTRLDGFKRDRDRLIEVFRRTGQFEVAPFASLEVQLSALAGTLSGEADLRVRLELATVVRLEQRYAEAAALFEIVALEADNARYRDIAFEAWIGYARAHIYGTPNHGEAERGYERALLSTGPKPTPKQLHDLAAYRAQILAARGDLDGALVASLETLRRAEKPDDRFYAELDTASILLNFAESCDFRKLIDAKTQEESSADGFGGCRRAVVGADMSLANARKSAESLGWGALANQASQLQLNNGMRKSLIEQRAGAERLQGIGVFEPKGARDVLVNRDFSAGASALQDSTALASLIETAVSEGATDPRSLYLRGCDANLHNDRATALDLFRQAADGLATERRGLFDPQRRGTVIENRIDVMRDLAISLLASGEEERAFETFESFRSRGLNELIAAFERPDISKEDREWLTDLVELEAQISARQVRIRERVIATQDLALSDAELQELQNGEGRRRALLADSRRSERFANVDFRQAGLQDLQRASTRSGIPVAIYWTTATNVIVWLIAPSGASEVRTVFLPEVVLNDRVRRVVTSAQRVDDAERTDEDAARQLYLYLIAPFEQWLAAPNLMIIPQGPLLDLPFEVLIDPQSGNYVAQKWAVSYAPNATLATKILSSKYRPSKSVRVIADPVINAGTHEADRILGLKDLNVKVVGSNEVDPADSSQFVASAKIVHILAHGGLDSYDPLMSSLHLSKQRTISAARLLAGAWRGVRLAVLSSCDSGAWARRISNEIHGFPWSLLVAGVDNVVVSRWRVEGRSNSDWMASFYGELSRRASPAGAAARAARVMIESGRRHPYYWAAMRVIGH
jgi:CHAT domain-containing protein